MIWLTDTHIEVGAHEPRDSAIRGALLDSVAWRADAVVHTGDIGDNLIANVRRGFALLRSTAIECPLITVIGNHDEEEITNPGVPNTAQIEAADCFDHHAPINRSVQLVSRDGTLRARVVTLDCNYNGEITPNHPTIGERIGHHTPLPHPGYARQLGAAQRAWLAAALAADTDSHIVMVLLHYPPDPTLIDAQHLADVLAADGRNALLFCGHIHPDARTYIVTGAASGRTYTAYKMPAGLESGCWCRVRVGPDGIGELTIRNFTQPGGWTINSPFVME